MLGMQVLEEMSEGEVLDLAGRCAETARRAEVDLLRVAYQWAVLHSRDRLDPVESALPGREKPRRWGGPGVAEVTEFAPAALGVRIGRSSFAARQLIADAQDLVHRHPRLWSRVESGEVRASYARHVVRATRDLQPAEAAYVDAGVAESADGRITWSRFEALLAAKVAQAAPALAREKEERAERARFARKLRGGQHGMASFLVRGDSATIDAIDEHVRVRADLLAQRFPDDPDLATHDQRAVRAVLLALAGAADDADLVDVLPQVRLVVHAYAGDGRGEDREEVMRVEGHGPVTEAWVRRVLGERARFTICPVFDLAGQAPVDAYEIPDRHRRAVELMTPADTFPYGACLAGTGSPMQVDHTMPYGDGGTSAVGNYGPMTGFHHRIKTHGRWQVRQPFPGIYVWRDPGGDFHLVDHTGTRPLRPPGRARPRARPLAVDLWRTHHTIDVDLAA